MDGSLKRAYELGMVRHSAKQEIFPLFKATVAKANLNALGTASADSRRGGNLAVADLQTGLLTVPSSFRGAMTELERSGVDKAQIIDKLNTGTMAGADVARPGIFYNGGWFIVNPSDSTKDAISTWPKALEKNQDSLMNTTLPDGRQIEAIPLRSESGGVFALFRVPKN